MAFFIKFSHFFFFIFILWNCSQKSELKKDKPKVIIQEVKSVNELENLKDFKKIITIGEEMTEAVIVLGDSLKIIAIDRTNPAYPNIKRPKVGYKATLKAEYILSHKPDLVLSDWEGSPENVVRQVMDKNVKYLLLKFEPNLSSIKDFITKVAKILKRKKDGEKLITQIDQQMDSVRIIRKSRKDSLRVLYIHARGPQVLLVGGVNTNVDALLKLAGAKNAAFEFEGMERLTGEDMQAMNPDFILMSKKGLESLQGRLYEVPAIFGSTAYRLGRVIVYDDYQLLNFGINSPKIALDLCKKLYKGQYFAPLPNIPFSTDPNQQPTVREQIKPEKVQPKTDVGLDDLKGGN